MKRRVAILISGRGSNMQALVEAAKAPDFPVEVVLVLSNRPDAAGLGWAESQGIATAMIDHNVFKKDRQAFEKAVQVELETARVDLVCLAGFMRLLTPWFIDQWHNRLINIHPSLLPSFKGLDTHARALEAGVKLHGCTVHFVRPDMDAGPIIAQKAVPVLDDDDPDSLAKRVLAEEHALYPHALAEIVRGLEGGWTIKAERVIGIRPIG
ncbi:MAG: phosphoribosylglycinamide formyltransferase [Hyphomicrobiales bacterium]|jgi:phosphoribosylglycinamide formyltransferase-1